jgi:hypothetical protein
MEAEVAAELDNMMELLDNLDIDMDCLFHKVSTMAGPSLS